MKVGDVHTSPSGHSFTVVAFDARSVTVDVERTVRKNGVHSPPVTEIRQRVLHDERFAQFSRPYTHLNGKKKAVPHGTSSSDPVRPGIANPKKT